jgi:hypothetical protein
MDLSFKFSKAKWITDSDGMWLMLLVPFSEMVYDFIRNLTGKEYDCTIKQHRQKRSLDANAYAWTLLNELANVLRISKEECYLMMLKRYGQHSVVSVVEEAAELFKRSVKYCEDYGEAELKGKKFKHIKVYMGSSEYDTRQMSILIDGIVSECKELGIETMTPAELERLKGEWGK